MQTPQSGILPENSSNAIFITANITKGDKTKNNVAKACSLFSQLTQNIATIDSDAHLFSVLGVSFNVWQDLMQSEKPTELQWFKSRTKGSRQAPSTPTDLFFHIRSLREDLNFELARAIRKIFADNIEIVEEIKAFKYLDARDMTGFVDGTENPEGDERAKVALVNDNDPAHAGGSYILFQRYVHNLKLWETLDQETQEKIIGRTKDTDEELDDDIKPATAHISRVVIEEDGEELEILRQSMPYGDSSEAGLCFVAYCHTPSIFDRMLDSMFEGDSEGHYDHLMDYTQAVSGAYYFAPSIEQLSTIAD